MNLISHYKKSVLYAVLIYIFLLIMSCILNDFDLDSMLTLYLYSIPLFTIKAIILFAAYLLLIKKKILNNDLFRILVTWMPFIVIFIWYYIIVNFKIQSLYVDIRTGESMTFPHFNLQLLSVFIVSIMTTVTVFKTLKIKR